MSRIYSLRVLSAFWLTAGKPTSLKMANTCQKELSLAAGAAGPLARHASLTLVGVSFLRLSGEGRAFG